jgi:hypothetical protein
MPSVTRLYLYWADVNMGDIQKVISSLLDLINSPHSSITHLSGRYIINECIAAFENPYSRIRGVSDDVLTYVTPDMKDQVARWFDTHRHRDSLIILLFRFHHYIVRQAGACIL